MYEDKSISSGNSVMSTSNRSCTSLSILASKRGKNLFNWDNTRSGTKISQNCTSYCTIYTNRIFLRNVSYQFHLKQTWLPTLWCQIDQLVPHDGGRYLYPQACRSWIQCLLFRYPFHDQINWWQPKFSVKEKGETRIIIEQYKLKVYNKVTRKWPPK